MFDKEAEVFKALADPTRLSILSVLSIDCEMSVTEICDTSDQSFANVSQPLGVLRLSRLVESRKEGQFKVSKLVERRESYYLAILD